MAENDGVVKSPLEMVDKHLSLLGICLEKQYNDEDRSALKIRQELYRISAEHGALLHVLSAKGVIDMDEYNKELGETLKRIIQAIETKVALRDKSHFKS